MAAQLKMLFGSLCLLVFVASCAINKKTKIDGYVPEEVYVDAYKTTFICGCINKATNGNLNDFFVKNDDPATFTEVEILSHSVAREADYIGRVYSEKIQPIGHPDAGYKRPLVAGCIRLGLSKEVNKIARKKYSEFLKNLGKFEMVYDE